MADFLSDALAAGQDIWGQLKPKQKPKPTGPMANYGPSVQDLADVLVRGQYSGKPLDQMPWHERALTTAEMVPPIAAHRLGEIAKGIGTMAKGLWTGAGGLFGDAVESALGHPGAGWKVMDPETGSIRPEANAELVDLAAALAGGGMATTKFAAPRLGIFGGKLAKTADLEALAKAEKMTAAGAHPDAIWKETGWGVGADGKWRFEIPDNASQIGGKSADEFLSSDGRSTGKMAGVLWHKDLFDAYPELRAIDASVTRLPNPGHSGSFEQLSIDGTPARISALSDGLSGETGVHGITLHEAQHAAQREEGFASGGSPKQFNSGPMFNKSANDLNFELSQAITGSGTMRPSEVVGTIKYADPKTITPIVEKYGFSSVDDAVNFLKIEDEKRSPFGQYRRLSGETEARNVQTRMNMTPEERRASPPWSTEDVPRDRQIVRFGNSGPQASLPIDRPIVPSLAESLAGEAPMGGGAPPRDDFMDFTRRPPEPDPVYVYHATNSERAQSISESGAVRAHGPSFGTDQSVWPDGAREKRSYWTTRPSSAASFAPEDGQPVLLRSKRSPSFKTESGTGDIFSTSPVKGVEYLARDGTWKPLAAQ